MPRKLKVIVFDDDPFNLESISLLVKRLGHEVLSFTTPVMCPFYSDDFPECTCDSPCADILITDNDMPKMTGLEFIRRQTVMGCKGVAKNKAILSGAWSEEDLRLADSLGCKILYKPIDPRELVEWIEGCLP